MDFKPMDRATTANLMAAFSDFAFERGFIPTITTKGT